MNSNDFRWKKEKIEKVSLFNFLVGLGFVEPVKKFYLLRMKIYTS